MNTQSSPGFDPFSASFIKHAEETVRDDRGKSHTENVLLPLLTDLFHLLLSDGVTPHLWHKVKITPLHKKGPVTSPQNYRLLANQWLCLQTFCKRGHGLVDRLGSCWTPNTRLTIFFLPHKEHQPTPLYSATQFSLLQKRKKWRCSLLFWTSLLPTTVCQERNFGDTCK